MTREECIKQLEDDFRIADDKAHTDRPCINCGAMCSFERKGIWARWRHASLGSPANWKAARNCRNAMQVPIYIDHRLFAWRTTDLDGWYFNGIDPQGYKLSRLRKLNILLQINWLFTKRAWKYFMAEEVLKAKNTLLGAN